MRLRNTLLLALIFAGLAGYLYFVEVDKAAEEAKKKTLFEIETEAVTGVTLVYPDRTIEVKKSDGKWRLTQPVDDLADEPSINNLVRAIAECEVTSTLEDVPADLAPFGLDQPKVEVKVTLTDRELPAIKVGKNTPVGFSTYIQRADEPKVYLTAAAFASGTDKQVKDLRDKQILTVDDATVRRIALQRPESSLTLKKTDEAWLLEEPITGTADAGTVRSFLSTMRSLRATDFAAEDASDLGAYGLDQPILTITLTGEKEDDQKQLLIGKENDKQEVFVKVGARPTIYTAGSFVLRDLNKSLNDFRDKTVLAFATDTVTGVDVQRGDGEQFSLDQKDTDTWTISTDPSTTPDKTKVTQFLTDLKDLKGYEIAAETATELEPFGLTNPELRITLRGAEGPITKLLVGAVATQEDKQEYTALREGQETIFLIRDFLFTRLNKNAKDFLPKPTPAPGSPAAAGDESEEDVEMDGGDNAELLEMLQQQMGHEH
jgi:hypothetical protein